MVNFYVSKDGNDGNAGTSWALAKLSIGAAVTASAANDTIYIAGGEYNEQVSASKANETFVGVGEVILRNNGVLLYGFNPTVVTYIHNIIADGYATGGFQTATITTIYCYNCTARNGAGNGFFLPYTYCYGCVAHNNAGYGIYSAYGGAVEHCITYSNGTYGLRIPNAPSYPSTCLNNISFKNTAAQVIYVNATENVAQLHDYNLYYLDGTTNIGTIGAANYTTLALFQAALTNGAEANSVSAAPEVNDAVNNLFGCVPTSAQLIGAGAQYQTIGIAPRYAMSGSINTAMITDGVFSDVEWDAVNKRLQLIAPAVVGYWRSNVIDLQYIRGFLGLTNIFANIVAPTDVVDYAVAEALPRQWTYRYRISNASFLKNDGVLAWVEANLTQRLTGVLGRYVQIELTLRTNGV